MIQNMYMIMFMHCDAEREHYYIPQHAWLHFRSHIRVSCGKNYQEELEKTQKLAN